MQDFPYGLTPVAELTSAVENGLLTRDEARLIIWSQHPILKQSASMTPPPVEK